MKKQNKSRLTGWSDYVTSTISVTLVLFLLGLAGLVNIAFSGIDRQIKENMGFTVMLTDAVTPQNIDEVIKACGNATYISEYTYLSAEQVLAEQTADDGNNLAELLGVNPYAPMLDIKVTKEYANLDSINRLVRLWQDIPYAEEVSANTEIIQNLNRNAQLINLVLIIMAAALLLISFVLINNTVRLTVYSRRFIIHTMKLVGAKPSFIRKPFMLVNALQGVLAGLVAVAMIAELLHWSYKWEPALTSFIGWNSIWPLMLLLVITGIIICLLSAFLATNTYLRKDYDQMFE